MNEAAVEAVEAVEADEAVEDVEDVEAVEARCRSACGNVMLAAKA